MRNQVVAVAWIHIVVGCFVLGCVGVLWFMAAQFTSLVKLGWIAQVVAMFGKPLAVALLIVGGAEVIGAVGLLREQGWGRITLMLISALEIFVFPIGTAVAAYTYWVLLKSE